MTRLEADLTSGLRCAGPDEQVPAVSVAVLYGGEVQAAAAGAEPSSLFQAASISKPVAALATLRLVARGVLRLDSPVNQYLHTWHLPESKSGGRVTLRH